MISSKSIRIERLDSGSSPTTPMKIIDLSDKSSQTSYLTSAKERFKDLSKWLNNREIPLQEKNMEAVIEEYKSGAVPDFDHPWWFVNGEKRCENPLLDFSTLPPQPGIWFEVCLHLSYSRNYC